MRTSVWVAPVASVVVLFGSVGIAQLTGGWEVSGRTALVAGERLGVDDLKGWMTLQQAADGLGVPVEELIVLIEGSGTAGLTPGTAFRDIEGLVDGFELSAYKDELRAHLEGTPVPSADPSGDATPATSSTDDSAPAITGRVTLAEVARANGIDLAELAAACGLPPDVDTRTTLKDLTDVYPSFEIQQVRDAVAQLS